MTREEMQRFLNYQAEDGKTKEEALDALIKILGINFPELQENEDEETD